MASFGNLMVPVFVLTLVFGAAMALQCMKCGQYNDGVGSITPCINYTHMQLINCPSSEHVYCIKYISEGSTVRDCVGKCTEKQFLSTRTYCCTEDGCNSSPTSGALAFLTITLVALALVLIH
ncbi:PREDICTED: uncharacterized protein LOC108557840 [Nicrophorus vespilloides]|uniref:Uncharacterized protein LOC108557840 n=1 Tax=Nicrophorus vespilloides TaxID=110193 RepID=A0ABM1M615_NICVS|nr:PREDICTED: uncharacterized protein LOC108557840 [Nicrophorus vespilloides]